MFSKFLDLISRNPFQPRRRSRVAKVFRERQFLPHLEPLESRTTPSCTVSVRDGILYAVGDNADTTFLLTASHLCGHRYDPDSGELRAIEIDTGGGNDLIEIISLPDLPVDIFEQGSGNDRVRLPIAPYDFQGFLGVYGNAGRDEMDVGVASYLGAITVDGSSVRAQFGGTGYINYYGNQQIVFSEESVPNTYNIEAVRAGSSVTINESGSGNDPVNLAPTSRSLGAIQGGVTVNGSAGSNTLTVFDQNDPANDTYTVTNSTLQRTGSGLVRYSSVGRLTINGGFGRVTFNIESTTSTTPVSIVPSYGANLNISPTAKSLSTIQGNVAMISEDRFERTVALFDQNDASNSTYSIVGSSVQRSASARISWGFISDVEIHGGLGNETFNVDAIAVFARLAIYEAGVGNNSVRFSPQTDRLEDIHGSVFVQGNGGFDSLILYDQNNPNTDSYTFTAGHFSEARSYVTINYLLMKSLTLYGGSGRTTFNVEGTDLGTPLTIYEGGSGDDVVNVSPATRFLDRIHGDLTVNGNAGANSLNIFDTNDPANDVYRITGASVQRSSAARINYSSVKNIVLYGGSRNPAFNIESTSAITPVTINEGAGDNTVNVSPAARNLDSIQGNLAVNGNSGNDRLFVFDQNKAASVTYILTNSTVQRTGSALVTYLRQRGLVIYAGSGNDMFNVQGTASGTTTTVNGGSGTTTVNLGNSVGLAGIDVAVSGGAGGTTVNVNPQGWVYGDTYLVTATTVSLPNTIGRVLTYSNLRNLNLNLGAGTNVVNIQSTAAGTQTAVNGGPGDNTFKLFPDAIMGSLTLDGRDGTNTLDYSAYTTNVYVNLQTGMATDVAGGIFNIQNVIGGHDGALGSWNILVGNGGNYLQGGNGRRNLLIAGGSASTLLGGDDDDILIGGTTDYDTDPAALLAIMAEWTRTDEDCATRIYNLTHGIGAPLLDSTTVRGNGGGNTLLGNGGCDLYFGNLDLDQHDWDGQTGAFISV